MADQKQNRGRSGEAQDPNRPVDETTGEKAGLGRPTTNPGTGKPMNQPDEAEDDGEDTTTEQA